MVDAEGRVELGAISAAPSDPPILIPEVRWMRDEVGWSPHFSLKGGLATTIDWWRAHHDAGTGAEV